MRSCAVFSASCAAVCWRIALAHAEQHQQARADLAGDFSFDQHAGARDSLQNGSHAYFLDLRRRGAERLRRLRGAGWQRGQKWLLRPATMMRWIVAPQR